MTMPLTRETLAELRRLRRAGTFGRLSIGKRNKSVVLSVEGGRVVAHCSHPTTKMLMGDDPALDRPAWADAEWIVAFGNLSDALLDAAERGLDVGDGR